MTGLQYFSTPDSALGYATFFVKSQTMFRMNIATIRNIRTYHPKVLRHDDILVDIASGPATTTFLVAQAFGIRNCFAVDGSPDMVQFIEKNARRFPGVVMQPLLTDMDSQKIPIGSNIAAVVTCVAGTMYFTNLENVLSETARILKPGYAFAGDIQLHTTKTDEPLMYMGKSNKADCFVHSEQKFRSLLKDFGFEILSQAVSPYGVVPGAKCYDIEYVLKKI